MFGSQVVGDVQPRGFKGSSILARMQTCKCVCVCNALLSTVTTVSDLLWFIHAWDGLGGRVTMDLCGMVQPVNLCAVALCTYAGMVIIRQEYAPERLCS